MIQPDKDKKPEQEEEPKPRKVAEVQGFSTGSDEAAPKRGFSFGGGFNITSVIPALAIGILLYIFMSSPQSPLVTKKDFTTNLGSVATDLAKIKTDVTQTLTNQNNTMTAQITNQNNAVDRKIAALSNQLDNYATKGSVDSLSGLTAQVNSQLTTAKAEQQTILNGVIENINSKLAAQSTNVSQEIQKSKGSSEALVNRVSSLETSPKVSGVQLSANVSNGQISLGVNSDQNQYVAFKVTFRLTSGNVTSNLTSDDFRKALYASPPVSLSTNLVLIPTYEYTWQNSLWYLTQVEFITARTAIAKGYQSKTLTYSFSDTTRTYEVMVEPLINSIVGTGGSNW